jgi:DNA polymerase I-like protein with 3'-5' exonuclease and polymerase domains
MPLGPVAVQALLGDRLAGRMSGTQPTAFIGQCIPDQDLQAWVCPIPGLKHTLKLEKKRDVQEFFRRHVAKACQYVGKPVPRAFGPADVTIMESAAEYTNLLRTIQPGMDVGFDYETTGLKPQREGHKIICAAVAWGPPGKVHAYSGKFYAGDPEFMAEWVRVVTDPEIGKTAHQSQFEDMWTKVLGGGHWVQGWRADTCLDAHIVNNEAPTSLKFLAYTEFGILGYDHEVDPYIGSKEKGGNEFNRMEEFFKKWPTKMLTYCGMDAIASEEGRHRQRETLREYTPQLRGSRFFMRSAPELARASHVGMRLDTGMLEANKRKLAVDMDETLKRIQSYPSVPKDFNPNAAPQVSKLFYDILGHKIGRGGRVADETALQSFGTPLAMDVLAWKKMHKLSSTYIDGFLREAVGGVIHPSYSLNKVVTYRSSSQDPNFQNIPKRDPIAKKAIRSAIKPRPGHILIEADYKAVEVSIGYCNHHDANMGRYLTDKSSDMHRDGASKIFLLPGSDVKPYRGDTKMLWTFAEFYGSKAAAFGDATYGEVTLAVWEYLQVHPELLAHMGSQGIKTLDALQEHLVACEKDLWTNMFPDYEQWKRDTWRFYQDNLYVPLKTGFRCWGPLGYNDATNYPIQGPAFHCLQWTMDESAPRIRDIAGEEEAAVCCEIHDALVIDCHPRHAEKVCEIVQEWGTRRLPQAWTWIDTPLTIEIESSLVNGSWADMDLVEKRSF